MKAKHIKRESGAIMLEGMIVLIVTIFVLLWILGLGFVYYQRYVTTIVTNDAAKKVASTYNNTSSDIIMGYVGTEALSSRDLYRLFPSGKLEQVNEDRAEAYIKYVLDKANFIGVVDNVEVSLWLVQDSVVRRHVQIETSCTYNTPFREALEMFGMKGVLTYRVTACADCTDYADYITTVDYGRAWTNGTFTSGTGIVGGVVKLLNTIVKTYNLATG